MTKSTFGIVAIVAAVALAGTAGLTVVATDDASRGQGGSFLSHLHELGYRLHGGGHDDQVSPLIEQLDLTPDQLQRLEKVHEIIGAHGGGEPGAMAELHEKLIAQFEQGHVDAGEIRRVIDRDLAQMRHMAYAVTDELIALVNELDATQREIVLQHIQGGSQEHHGHGG